MDILRKYSSLMLNFSCHKYIKGKSHRNQADPDSKKEYFNTLRKKRVDGIILKSAGKNEDYEGIKSSLKTY